MVLIPYTARDTTLKQSPREGRGRGAPRGDQLRRLPRALPPHWNTLANYVIDHPLLERRLGGDGPVFDPLEWDVKLYLALNGAVHDAAVCAWGLKGHYDYVRPISAIRHMAGLGQSSDPELPSYDPHGLPLEPGVAELITEESAPPASATPTSQSTSERSPSSPGSASRRRAPTRSEYAHCLGVNWERQQRRGDRGGRPRRGGGADVQDDGGLATFVRNTSCPTGSPPRSSLRSETGSLTGLSFFGFGSHYAKGASGKGSITRSPS